MLILEVLKKKDKPGRFARLLNRLSDKD